MTDPTKPPERIYISEYSSHLVGGGWCNTRCSHDDHAYILASSLPGTVEQIRELVAAAQAVHDSRHIDPKNSDGQVELIRLNIALAAMKKEQP